MSSANGFKSLDEARPWVLQFTRWYNVRNCEPVGPTTLNPEKKPVKQEEKQAA